MNARTDAHDLVVGGGTPAGRFFVDDRPYLLIVAPKDSEIAEIAWNTTRKSVPGALSFADGLTNTDAMAAAGSELAKAIRALDIDGFTDWYLPSRLEALLMFSTLGREPAAGFEREWYWTSTQVAGLDAYAWIQHFYGGHQYNTTKDWSCRARAVRRVPIR